MAGNFAALWPTDPNFLALEDLNPFKKLWKVQQPSGILKVGFALSKWPHLHSAYVVSVLFSEYICISFCLLSMGGKKVQKSVYLVIEWPLEISFMDDTNLKKDRA